MFVIDKYILHKQTLGGVDSGDLGISSDPSCPLVLTNAMPLEQHQAIPHMGFFSLSDWATIYVVSMNHMYNIPFVVPPAMYFPHGENLTILIT